MTMTKTVSPSTASASSDGGFADAATFGFSPAASGLENTRALQRAADHGGTIVVSRPGVYPVAGTVYLGSHTSLVFSNGVFLKKTLENGPFSHVLLNKGALTKTYDEHIVVDGLQIIVNEVDAVTFADVYGLQGHLAFFYVKDLRIEHFRCLDLGRAQYGIHVCTFEDVVIDDVIIKGDKDGVHFGRGKRFTVRNGVFTTHDDAVALNAHDYDVGNPELGWIEDGLIENCHDLADGKPVVGFFCRILAGGWVDWTPGMKVQKSDTVVANGRLYRVFAEPDGTVYESTTQPSHASGKATIDGIDWVMVQADVTYTAGVRNVVFRDIFLQKPRIGLSIHFDSDRWSRSYYPGAQIPMQEQLVLDNVRVLCDEQTDFLSIGTPVDVVTVVNSSFRHSRIRFHGNQMPDYGTTKLNVIGCVFRHPGAMDLVVNEVANKVVELKTTASVELGDQFSARIVPGDGTISVESDLIGLNRADNPGGQRGRRDPSTTYLLETIS